MDILLPTKGSATKALVKLLDPLITVHDLGESGPDEEDPVEKEENMVKFFMKIVY